MQTAAGLILYRSSEDGTEVFLVHPGGPYWHGKDDAAWSIPKGLCGADEDPFDAALREFNEETGFSAKGPFLALGVFTVRAGKTVEAWAACGDCDPGLLKSNAFSMEWPPRSGRQQSFPEVDRGAWFGRAAALCKITPGQRQILDALYKRLAAPGDYWTNTSSGAAPRATNM